MSLKAPPPRVTPRRCTLTRATPDPLETRLSMSPAWWLDPLARPCGVPCGLKWPPALLASTALQSPFSCTWKPKWPSGCNPPTSPRMCTPSLVGTRVSLPLTRLPEAEASTATACWAVLTGAGGAGAAGGGALLQAAMDRTATVHNKVRMTGLPGRMSPHTLSQAAFTVDETSRDHLPARRAPVAPRARSAPARSQLAGDRVAAHAQQCGRFHPAPAGVFQGCTQQGAVEPVARMCVQVARTGLQAGPRPLAEL